MRWVIFFLLVFSPSFLLAQERLASPLDSIPRQERNELADIIALVCLDDLDHAKHKRFWEIINRHGFSKGDVQEIFDRLLSRCCVRKRYMMLAVLDAFEKKKDTKGPEFKEYEVKLLKMGILPPEEIKESDEFIYKVAHGEPVKFPGLWGGTWAETVFNNEWAEDYHINFAILDKQYKRLLQLFEKDWGARFFPASGGPE
ncbi:MAG: hypothetical protein ACK4WF_01575 [Candidatus Brocadiales bacterium]